MKTVQELYNYRHMLFSLVRKDLRVRYKGSFLGFLWTFLNPLLQLFVYYTIFSIIMRTDIENYAMYLFIGLVPWMFFSTSILESTTSIINNTNLIKKIYFPRLLLPISVASSAFMNMVYTMVVVIISVIVSGVGISQYIVFLPLIMIMHYLMVIGGCLLAASLNVYFRDLQHILNIIMMMWFYFTPIIYDMKMIPDDLVWAFQLNPMTVVIQSYRDVLFYGNFPDLKHFAVLVGYSLIILFLGVYVFGKLQKKFAEEL